MPGDRGAGPDAACEFEYEVVVEGSILLATSFGGALSCSASCSVVCIFWLTILLDAALVVAALKRWWGVQEDDDKEGAAVGDALELGPASFEDHEEGDVSLVQGGLLVCC